jgi:hypothetical protein
MVQQVFVWEKASTGSASLTVDRLGLAFGDHPDIPADDDRVVDRAVAIKGNLGGAKVRVILDELVRGNDIEEVECLDGTYSRVPVGTDPDDIARCSGPDLSRCEAVCVDHGGIKDLNADGAVDNDRGFGFRMIDYGGGELAASVVCDGQMIPLKRDGPERSFYNPSGDQIIPYDPATHDLNLEGLGPALVLFPSLGLPTNATCTVRFRPEVVDKDGNRVCAPPDGDIGQDCVAEGNTDAIQFRVEPLAFRFTIPREGGTLNPASPAVQLGFVAEIDPASLGAITMSTGGADVEIAATLAEGDATTVNIEVPGGYVPDSQYTITVDTGLADILGGTLPEPLTVHFTTTP